MDDEEEILSADEKNLQRNRNANERATKPISWLPLSFINLD
jgi:hypothetical protein